MSHYFSEDNKNTKSNPKVIAFRVHKTDLKFHTDHGVFAKDNLDRGTEILLKYMTVEDEVQTALDLGCGYGVIGVYLNKTFGIEVDMVDINERAIELSTKNVPFNAAKGNVYKSDGFQQVNGVFDLIVLNPPIRAGKQVIYKMFEEAIQYLSENGSFYIVINKKHGAQSALKKLETIYGSVEIVDREKGFYVIKSKK